MPYNLDDPLVVSTWGLAREAYRSKNLRQGLYDGGVVMDNVLINLHGREHRDRRRLENPLFRRDVLFRYERAAFPAVLKARLAPHLASGHLELLSFGHAVMLELAAINAGVDLDVGDSEATQRLSEQLLLFIDGARILHFTGDKQAKEREVAEALENFERQFILPAISRRQGLLEQHAAGLIHDDEVPRDVLRVMLENVENLDLDQSTIVRETAFFLLTGASTSAVALTLTLDRVFQWIQTHPEDDQRVRTDTAFLQRCVLESLRLSPISPIGARWATADFVLSDGTEVTEGDRVHIDMANANRDVTVFGSDADKFNPDRVLPADVPRAGVSFGHGMHHCIGQELAVGVLADEALDTDTNLFGLVGTVIRELLLHGVRPDPNNAPQQDDLSDRGTFRSYPVLIHGAPSQP